VENIKTRVSTHLANGRTTKHSTTRGLIGTLTFTRFISGRIVAKHLGLDRCYIYQCLQRRNLINDGAIDFLFGTKRCEQCTTLLIELKTLVEWWTMETTISLNWKRFAKKELVLSNLQNTPPISCKCHK